MRLKLAHVLTVLGALAITPAIAAEPEDTMIITLKDGDVVVALRPDLAPKHVEQIKKLVREGRARSKGDRHQKCENTGQGLSPLFDAPVIGHRLWP